MRIASFLWHVFDGFKTRADNVNGLMPELMRDAELVDVQESAIAVGLSYPPLESARMVGLGNR